MDKILFSHASDEWSTPKEIYDLFKAYHYFDVCPLNGTRGLIDPWPEKVFCNPPYSNIEAFVDKFIEEWTHGDCLTCWLLVPARTDTKWFSKALGYSDRIIFISGRLSFGDCGKPAPFPSLLMRLSYDDYGRKAVYTISKRQLVVHLKNQL